MATSRLKIYHGPPDGPTQTLSKSHSGENCLTVSLGEVLPLLIDTAQSQRTWLGDFEDDEVVIPTDLYEVLLAYQYFQRPAS